MSSGFTNQPDNWAIPLFWAQFDNSQAGVNINTQKTLIIGQSIAAQMLLPQYVPSTSGALANFGAASHLARMIGAYRANDPIGTVDALPLTDLSGGTAATGAITITGPATAAGTLEGMIAGQEIPLAVSSGSTATAIATGLAAAINAMNTLPVTAIATSGVVALTAIAKGTLGNAIDVRLNYYGTRGGESTPAGLTIAVTAMSGGAGDPDLTGLDAIVQDAPYDFIAMPYTGSAQLAAMKAQMGDSTGRWSISRGSYGHVFSAQVGSAANLLTFGATVNDQHLTVAGIAPSPTPPWEWAAAWCGAEAPALKANPARPTWTLPVQGVLAPVTDFTLSQKQTLLTTGISLASFGSDGSATIQRSVTTYQTNAFGQADQSYYDDKTMYQLMEITRRMRAITTQKFPRCILADDGTPFGAGQPVVTPSIYKAEIAAAYRQMESDGLVENATAMLAATIVQRNAANPARLDVLWAPYLTSGLAVVSMLNQFRLSAAA